MKINKFLKLAAPLLVVVPLLVGCGPEKDPVEEGATLVTMYVHDFEDWSNAYMTKRAKEFNSNLNDGLQLELKFFEDEAYTDAMKVARENGHDPDIFMCSYGNLYHDVVEPDVAVDLTQYIKQEYIADIADNIKPMVTFGTKVMGYPQLSEPSSIFFYRKSALAKAGVAKGPTTWAELLDACAKIKPTLKRGQYCCGVPIGSGLSYSTVGMQYNLSGTYAISDDWTECMINKDCYKELGGLWYDLYGNGYVPLGAVSASGGYNDIIEGMMMDKIAMTFAGSWSVAEIMSTYPDLASDVGVSVIPTKDGDTSKCTATNGGWTFCISKNIDEDHKKAAAKVIEWYFAEDAARTAGFFEAAYYSKAAVTNSVRSYLTTNVSGDLKEWTDVINDVASKAIPEPIYPWGISTAVGTMLETCGLNSDVSRGDAYRTRTIEEALAAAVNSIETIIKASSFPGKPVF